MWNLNVVVPRNIDWLLPHSVYLSLCLPTTYYPSISPLAVYSDVFFSYHSENLFLKAALLFLKLKNQLGLFILEDRKGFLFLSYWASKGCPYALTPCLFSVFKVSSILSYLFSLCLVPLVFFVTISLFIHYVFCSLSKDCHCSTSIWITIMSLFSDP